MTSKAHKMTLDVLKRILFCLIALASMSCQASTSKPPSPATVDPVESIQPAISTNSLPSYINARSVSELAITATTIVIGQVKQADQVINKARNVNDIGEPDLTLLSLGQVYRMDIEEVIKGELTGSELFFVQSEGFLVKPQDSIEPSPDDVALARQNFKYIPFREGQRYLLFLEPLVGFEAEEYYINIMPHPWRFDVTDPSSVYPESPSEWLNIRPAPLATILEEIRRKPAPTVDSPLPTVTPTAIPTLVIWETPQLSAIEWSEPPRCENQPASIAEWKNRISEARQTEQAQVRLYFKRIQAINQTLRELGTIDELADHFLQDAGVDEEQLFIQHLIGLWLNIINGQINRETEIQLETFPDIKTVNGLLRRAEQEGLDLALQRELRQAIATVLTGEAIRNPVCANLLLMQFDDQELRSQLWSRAGIRTSDYAVKDQIVQEGWIPGLFQIAPDFQKIVIEAYSHEGGGPIYLYDVTTRSLRNLLSALSAESEAREGALPFSARENWQIIGWHPDSQHLLLGIQGQTVVIWVDIKQMTFDAIDFGSPQALVDADDAYLDLLPDGSGFIYVSTVYDGFSEAGLINPKLRLSQVKFDTQETQVLLESAVTHTSLYYPRVSPTGTTVAFVVEAGETAPEITYSLQLLNLSTGDVVELVKSDHLGRTLPTWSPDGKQIAFTWSAPETRGVYPLFPELDGWRGNLWVIAVETQQMQQVTFLEGAARRPTWSVDGKTLMFFTHNGQFGATQINDDKTVWPITEGGPSPIHYGSLVTIP